MTLVLVVSSLIVGGYGIGLVFRQRRRRNQRPLAASSALALLWYRRHGLVEVAALTKNGIIHWQQHWLVFLSALALFAGADFVVIGFVFGWP